MIWAGRWTGSTEPPLIAMSSLRPMAWSERSAAWLAPPFVRIRIALGPGVTSKRFLAAGGMSW